MGLRISTVLETIPTPIRGRVSLEDTVAAISLVLAPEQPAEDTVTTITTVLPALSPKRPTGFWVGCTTSRSKVRLLTLFSFAGNLQKAAGKALNKPGLEEKGINRSVGYPTLFYIVC